MNGIGYLIVASTTMEANLRAATKIRENETDFIVAVGTTIWSLPRCIKMVCDEQRVYIVLFSVDDQTSLLFFQTKSSFASTDRHVF